MSFISYPTVKYVLQAAVRDKLILSLLLVIALGTALSVFLGSAAYVEKYQFILVFTASGLRIFTTMGLVLFCVFFIRRSFDNRDVDYLLSRPISRVGFIVSHALAFSVMAVLLGAACTIALYFSAPITFGSGHMVWGLSLIFELMIMANAALFFSMVLPSASSSSMIVFALYVLGRTIGILLGIVQSGLAASPMMKGLSFVMEFVSLIIPRLDLMVQTNWLLYGVKDISLTFIVAQGIVFSALLVTAAIVDLVRRQF
ncbi:MAG: hypothetical protein ACK4NR_06285 [Micavibrio sp.]